MKSLLVCIKKKNFDFALLTQRRMPRQVATVKSTSKNIVVALSEFCNRLLVAVKKNVT